MPPDTITAPEQRTIDVDVESIDTRGRTLHGYASVYGVLSHDLGGFRERIAPGAFAGVLDADVRCLLNHDASQVLARSKSGTLRLHDEARGLRFEADLPDSPLGQNVREAVRRGDIDGASFRFKVGEEDWEGEVRTVRTVAELHDVTVATYGAYPDASVELRTRSNNEPPRGDTATEEANVPQTTAEATASETTGGGLAVEDRTVAAEPTIEQRVTDALRSVRKGESRALTTAAAIAPPEISTYLFDKLRAASVALASGLMVMATDRDSIQWPKLTADVAPGFYGELDVITAGDPGFATLTATPRKIAHRVEFSNEVVDDSDPSAVEVVRDNLMKMLALRLDLAVYEGSGTAPEIRGLKNVAGIQTVSMGTNGGAITNLDPLADALGLLAQANTMGDAIVMSPRTWVSISKLKDAPAGSNAPLLTESPTEAAPPRILGVPVFISSQLPVNETQGTATNTSSIWIYKASEVILVRRKDVEIELDRSRLFDRDGSELRGKLRADLIVPNPQAVVRIAGVTP